MKLLRAIGLAAALLPIAFSARAQDTKSGDIVIETPWSRATPKGSPVGAGYLVIRNTGSTPDKLLGGSSDGAKDVQVHEMSMDGGVMKMRQLAAGLDVPPGATVELKPGGYHLMLMNLTKPLEKGQTLKIMLTFEHAGKVPVEFTIGGIGDTGPAGKPEAPSMNQGMNTAPTMDHGAMKMSH
jgi:copper(I)-binding protein